MVSIRKAVSSYWSVKGNGRGSINILELGDDHLIRFDITVSPIYFLCSLTGGAVSAISVIEIGIFYIFFSLWIYCKISNSCQ